MDVHLENDGGEEDTLLAREVGDFDEGCDASKSAITVDEALQRIGFGRYQYRLCVALGWALSADAIEVYAVSFLLPFALCELQPSSLEKGVLGAVGFAGMLVGALLWGTLADTFGRQKALLWCQVMNALFSVSSSFTQNFPYLIITRLLSGVGVGGTLPVMSVYFIEFLPPQKRGRWMGFFVCFWMIGQFMISGLAWVVLPREDWDFSRGGFRFNSWRIFLLLASLPCLTSAMMFFVFPESPRFLVQKGKVDEAMHIFRRIFSVNNRNKADMVSFPPFTLRRPSRSSARQLGRSCITSFLNGAMSRTAILFTHPRHRVVFPLMSIIYFCLGFSSYGLGMWFPELFKRMEHSNGTSVCSAAAAELLPTDACNASTRHDEDNAVFMDTFLQAVATLPGNIIFMYIVDIVGRKVILGGSLVVSGVMVVFIWLVKSRFGSVALSMAFNGVNVFSWNSLALVAPELFSTDVRSTAQGLQTAMIRLASICANITFGALIDTHCSVAILLMGAALVVGGFLAVFLPNTTKTELH